MNKAMRASFLLVVLVGMMLATVSVEAQSIFLEPNSAAGIHLEALRPGIEGVNYTNVSFAFFLSGRVRVGQKVHLRAEVPYMTFNYDIPTNYTDENGNPYPQPSPKSTFGNPYVGIDFGDLDHGFQGEAGFRIPVLEGYDQAASVGVLTDPVERMEAFASDVTPLYLGANYRLKTGNGFGMRLRLVPVFWMYSGTGSRENDLFLLYSAQAWYEDAKVGVGGGFSGRFIATGEEDGFGERSLHQFGFFANYAFGRIMPGFQVRIPLDSDLKDHDPWEYDLGIGTQYSLSIGVEL